MRRWAAALILNTAVFGCGKHHAPEKTAPVIPETAEIPRQASTQQPADLSQSPQPSQTSAPSGADVYDPLAELKRDWDALQQANIQTFPLRSEVESEVALARQSAQKVGDDVDRILKSQGVDAAIRYARSLRMPEPLGQFDRKLAEADGYIQAIKNIRYPASLTQLGGSATEFVADFGPVPSRDDVYASPERDRERYARAADLLNSLLREASQDWSVPNDGMILPRERMSLAEFAKLKKDLKAEFEEKFRSATAESQGSMMNGHGSTDDTTVIVGG